MNKLICVMTKIVVVLLAMSAAAEAGFRDQVDAANAIVWARRNFKPKPESDQFEPVQAVLPAVEPLPEPEPVEQSPPPPVEQPKRGPMRFERIGGEPIKAIAPVRRQVFLFTGEAKYGRGWCVNCPTVKARLGNGSSEVEIIVSQNASPDDDPGLPMVSYPAIRWRDDLGKLRIPTEADNVTYHIPRDINELASFVRNSIPDNSANLAAAGGMMKLHASAEIAAFIEFWIQRIGVKKADGSPVKMSFAWRRTGGQTFPLLHSQPKQWSTPNIFGTLGEFEFSAPGSKLPIEPILVGYRRSHGQLLLRGEISIDEKMLGLPGDVDLANSSDISFDLSQATPNGCDPMTLLTIVSVIRTIFSLLNPTCDLTLGGQVTATAWYDEANGQMVIDFGDAPMIKLVWLFEFDLSLKQLKFVPTNLHLEFNGSRLVKSRDIPVE